MSTQTLTRETKAKETKTRHQPINTLKENTNHSSIKTHTTTSQTVEQWLSQSRSALDEIYKKSKSGNLPQGDTLGTAIFAGGPFPELFAKIANLVAWQGKVFDLFSPDFNSGVVVNKVSPVDLNLIVAKVYRGSSWMDGKDTIIIDYSGTSLFAKQIRDEMREVEPGLYLGKVWWGKTRILDFALEANQVILS